MLAEDFVDLLWCFVMLIFSVSFSAKRYKVFALAESVMTVHNNKVIFNATNSINSLRIKCWQNSVTRSLSQRAAVIYQARSQGVEGGN